MRYLLDTDHLSILQREVGQDYVNLASRIAQHSLSEFAVSIITFHEQILGCHTYINRARNSDQMVKGYEIMARIRQDFAILPVIQFDQAAAKIFDDLQAQRLQLATMDLRIAAIACCRGLTLLTRNNRDFGKVPELVTEDWTISGSSRAE